MKMLKSINFEVLTEALLKKLSSTVFLAQS